MGSNQRLEESSLLEHLSRVRLLAGHLVADPNLAEDILQDVYLLALERPPRRARAGIELWAWLRQVTRTLARQHFRAERRRKERERKVAVCERVPSFVEDLAQRERAADIRTVLLGMPEPYGSTLRRRLLMGMEPMEIARIHGVPAATVRMRLTRGLRMAKKLLDSRSGRRHAGAPFGFFAREWLPRWRGVVVLGGAAALLVTWYASLAWAGGVGPIAPTRAVTTHEVRSAASIERDSVRTVRRDVVDVDPARFEQDPLRDGLQQVAGQVLWTDGSPAAGIALRVSGSRRHVGVNRLAPAVSAPDGTFILEVDLPESGVRWVTTSGRGQCAVLAGALDRDALLGSPVVVVAETTGLTGGVFDENGQPVRGARVKWLPPFDLRHRLGASTTFTKPIEVRFETDALGGFLTDAVPIVQGAGLSIEVDGLVPVEVPLDLPMSGPLIVRLATRSQHERLRGRVVGSDGAPVQGASVCSGLRRCLSGRDGSFELAWSRDAGRVRVMSPGLLPGGYESSAGSCAESTRQEVRLVSPAARIRGRVVDAAGRPLLGIRVMVADLEAAYRDGDDLWSVEGLTADLPRPVPMSAVTDAKGRFSVEGLSQRSYRLLAVDPVSLAATEMKVPAGEADLAVPLSSAEHLPEVTGIVRAQDGRPIGGASVWVVRETVRILADGHALAVSHIARDVVRAAADGTFRLRDVPRDAWVHVEAAGFMPRCDRPAAMMEFRGVRRCEIALADAPSNAQFVRFMDAAGVQLPLLVFEHTTLGTSVTDRCASLVDRRSSVLTVSPEAASLEWLDGHRRLLGSMRVSLDPDRFHRLSLGRVESR